MCLGGSDDLMLRDCHYRKNIVALQLVVVDHYGMVVL